MITRMKFALLLMHYNNKMKKIISSPKLEISFHQTQGGGAV